MATTGIIAEGVSGFVSLTKSAQWKGKDTGNYSITLTVDKDNVKKFKDAGARIGEYEGKPQIKMTRKMDFDDGVFGFKSLPRASLRGITLHRAAQGKQRKAYPCQ